MKGPCPEKLAHSLKPTHPKLALDLLRACGYTRRAAKQAIVGREAATLCKGPNT